MKDEIKEILDKLQKVANRETASRNALMEMKDKDYQLLLDYITNLQEENERLNNIIKNLDKMFEYYFLGNLKYDQDTVNTIYIKYVKLKELKGSDKQ